MTLLVEVAPSLPADAVAVGVVVPADVDPIMLPAVLAGTESLTAAQLSREGFTARVGQSAVRRSVGDGADLILLGLGKPADFDAERWRRAAASLVRAAGEGGTAVFLVDDLCGVASVDVGAAIAEGAMLAAYRFEEYRSKPRPSAIERLVVVPAEALGAVEGTLALGVARGARTAEAVLFARDLINTPPSELPPARLAERCAALLGATPHTSVEVWEEERIVAERLGGLLGVSRGSDEPPRLVRATYEPPDPVVIDGATPHVVLVGKGITFDSGGLSLKTADGMVTMKTDMSGAAIVLATLSACADLGIRVRVTAIAAMAENMPGPRALKPGDVLTIRNTATIEVLNTDAEGRLVLADALSLAAEIEPAPDVVIDIATLTGAATVALGTGVAALFSNNEALADRIQQAGGRAGERLWPMPMPEDYADHIDSDVADMKNMGRAGQAGAIAAAMLLARFVGDLPWVHLDIAGTGRASEASGYLSKGGTAFGVRTLLELLASCDSGDSPS